MQAVAETLAGLVFARLIDPDVRAIFAPKPMVADLRTGSMCGDGGEQAILMAATAQMGRHYDLPTSSIAGISDAKTLDAQFGSEKCPALTMAAHSGSNLITQSCWMQASLPGVSFEAYAADDDMLGNILRTLRGVEVTPENIATDVIATVCHDEGHYLGQTHTFECMTSDYCYPHIGDRRTPTDWENECASTVRERARTVARQLINEHFPTHLDNKKGAQLRAMFDIRLPRQTMGKSS